MSSRESLEEVKEVGRSDGAGSGPVEVESGPAKVTGGLCRTVTEGENEGLGEEVYRRSQ